MLHLLGLALLSLLSATRAETREELCLAGADNATFTDSQGYGCGDWAGYPCADDSGTYDAGEIFALRSSCPNTCSSCDDAPVTTTEPPPTMPPPTTPPPTHPGTCVDGTASACDESYIRHVCEASGDMRVFDNACFAACRGVDDYVECTPQPTRAPSTSEPTVLAPTEAPATLEPTPAPSNTEPTVPEPTPAPTTLAPTPAPTPLDPEMSCRTEGRTCAAFDAAQQCQCHRDCLMFEQLDAYRNSNFRCCADFGPVCEPVPTAAPTTMPSGAPSTMPSSSAPTVAESCAARCGAYEDETATCSCDDSCGELGDCCDDYHDECVVTLAPSPPRCIPFARGCHECGDVTLDDNTTVVNRCTKCRDARFLLAGRCLAVCPEGYEGLGSGTFNRVCIDAVADGRCEAGRGHCHTCAVGGTSCDFCADSHFLHDGACHAECPDGTVGVGNGRYRRYCTAVQEGENNCAEFMNGCRFCTDDGGACTKCMDSTYLHDGTCHDACPAGTEGVGNGRFSRVCIDQTPTDECIESVAHCQVCDGGGCTNCRDRTYLHDGTCHIECPAGTEGVGNGNFRRTCRAVHEPTDGCTPGAGHCHECNNDLSACTKCRDARYLHDNGTCHDGCPSGTEPVGNGRFRRLCRALAPVPETTAVVTTTATAEPQPETEYSGPSVVCVGQQTTPDALPCRCTGNCHTCVLTPDAFVVQTCYHCRDGMYLFRGRCIDEFECTEIANGVPTGNGDYNRECLDTGAQCRERANDCHSCNIYGTACTTCREATYLHDGVCRQSCPGGFHAAGAGNYGRTCQRIE